jgi:LEA14-like dessication related protein
MKRHTLCAMIIGCLLLVGGCKDYVPLEVGKIKDLKLNTISTSQLDLTLRLPIRNPNLYSIKVTKIEGSAFLSDKKAGTIQSTEKIKIPGNSDKIHEVPLSVDYSELISAGMDFMKILKEGKVDVRIKGNLTATSFLYKKEVQFNQQRTLNLQR